MPVDSPNASVGVVAGVAVLMGLGCTVGSGSGVASGLIFIEDCDDGGHTKDLGTRAMPKEFDLRPTFFAGEPNEDIREVSRRTNTLRIRMQRAGGGVEVNDVLAFHIVDLYEVARCARAREVIGADGTVQPDYNQAICFVRPGALPRLRIGPGDLVNATLGPRSSCDSSNIVARAVSCTGPNGCQNVAGGNWESWIELEYFGSARQTTKAPADRDPVGANFKVDFDQRLRASFSLTLVDDRVLRAPIGTITPPVGQIGGNMSGWFDFDLERGRATQTFP